MDSLDRSYGCIKPTSPKYSMHLKPDMVIGGEVISWTRSIPGPKYVYSTDSIKHASPKFTIGEKQEMVIGGNVPSWTNSIPGPKYAYNIDTFRPRQPVFTMGGRSASEGKISKDAPQPSALDAKALETAVNFTKNKPPSFSIGAKVPVCGAGQGSWVASIPGPKYKYDADVIKKKPPNWSMGVKLKSEGEIMSVRSPGPCKYEGAAIDAKKQGEVDSTKRKSFSCGMGVGPRWGGTVNEMLRHGALSRYEKPSRR